MHTFYSIQVRVPGEILAYHNEGAVPETEAQALAAINELPNGWHVERVIFVVVDREHPEAKDVTADLADLAKEMWLASGHHPDHDTAPDFIADHASDMDSVSGYRGPARVAA